MESISVQQTFWLLQKQLPNPNPKGGLISEGILNLVTLPKKGAKCRPWAESLNLPPFTVNNLFKLSAQGRDLAPFVGNGTKVQIFSEIKLPLV